MASRSKNYNEGTMKNIILVGFVIDKTLSKDSIVKEIPTSVGDGNMMERHIRVPNSDFYGLLDSFNFEGTTYGKEE